MSTVVSGADVYLAITPMSEDGADDDTEDGAVPPVLEVVIAP